MDYVQPSDVVGALIDSGAKKARLAAFDLLIRGALSGALLGVATSLALGATVQTGQPIVGALVFPVGFVMIVLMGLELVTGSFAILPMAFLARRATFAQVLGNWAWVFAGNLIGALIYAGLLSVVLNAAASPGHPDPLAAKLAAVATAKTLAYQKAGAAGAAAAFVKAMLCNWMVCMGVVMAATSTSTAGKILAAWLPIVTFFGQGFEHSVVNMFVIPAGILSGAKVGLGDWWLWNQIPVTLGNLVGGLAFTGLALFATYRVRPLPAPAVAAPANALPTTP